MRKRTSANLFREECNRGKIWLYAAIDEEKCAEQGEGRTAAKAKNRSLLKGNRYEVGGHVHAYSEELGENGRAERKGNGTA